MLDRIDRQILHALQLAPRAPFARMGSVLGVCEQTVARRYQRLRTHGAVRVLAVSDLSRRPGTTYWTLRIGCRPGTAAGLADALARRGDTSGSASVPPAPRSLARPWSPRRTRPACCTTCRAPRTC
ncbi:MAG TPA: AsnC family protein [Actinoplanes sp.]